MNIQILKAKFLKIYNDNYFHPLIKINFKKTKKNLIHLVTKILIYKKNNIFLIKKIRNKFYLKPKNELKDSKVQLEIQTMI